MKHIAMMLWLMVSVLFGREGLGFEEERYIYSIDKRLSFTGSIVFNASGMTIDYTKPETKRVVYTEKRLQVFDGEGTLKEDVDLEKDPGMKLYMQFLLWLYRGDITALEQYFTVEHRGDELHLYPIAPTDKVVTSVKVLQHDGAPRFIKTLMSNRNEISIDIAR